MFTELTFTDEEIEKALNEIESLLDIHRITSDEFDRVLKELDELMNLYFITIDEKDVSM